MKKLTESLVILLVTLLLFQFESIEFKASSAAAFYVQTAVLEDNTIEVCVYLDRVDNIGGMDLELIYDSDKATFVDSSLGDPFKSSLSDIYHDKENEKIHYVVLCSDSKPVHGILLRAIFKTKEEGAYQLQLVVNELLDNSVEIKEIPYEIVYQQADETWEDTQDVIGEEADESIIEDAKEKHNSLENLKETEDGKRDNKQNNKQNNNYVPRLLIGFCITVILSSVVVVLIAKRRNK